MHKRRYLIGALLGVLGALVVSGTAMAGSPQSQTLQTTVAPTKLDKKRFSGVSLHNIIITNYDNFVGSASAKETIFFVDRNIKVSQGNTPACPLSSIANKPNATAQAACSASVVGQGTALVNGGALTAKVLLISGGTNVLYVHTDINNGALILTLTGAYSPSASTLDVTGLPNTPGADLTNFDTTFNKVKNGKNSFYIAARCPKKKSLTTSETTSYYNNQSLSASSTQRCKQKPSKK
jgi:hypothetical protein